MLRPFILALCITVAGVVEAEELRIPIPNKDDLVLRIPDEWKAQVRSPRPDLPPTIGISSPNRGELLIMVTPIWPVNASVKPPTDEDIRGMVRNAASSAKGKAVETDLPVLSLGAPGMSGYYFSATDRDPAPNEYKYLTQGAIGLGELKITFTVLMNGDPGTLRQRALEVLRGVGRQAKKSAT